MAIKKLKMNLENLNTMFINIKSLLVLLGADQDIKHFDETVITNEYIVLLCCRFTLPADNKDWYSCHNFNNGVKEKIFNFIGKSTIDNINAEYYKLKQQTQEYTEELKYVPFGGCNIPNPEKIASYFEMVKEYEKLIADPANIKILELYRLINKINSTRLYNELDTFQQG